MKKVITFVITFVLLVSFVLPFAAADESNQRKWRKKFISITRDELSDALFAFLSVLNDYDESYLSSMSYEKLVELKDQINFVMWNSEQWQEVTVPPGVYEIGKDIPSGHWSVRPAKGCGPDYIIYASASKDQGHDVDLFAGFHIMECICDPSAPYYSGEYKTSTDIDMESGFFVRLDCTMIFSPYSGKPDLGFK